MNKKCENCKHYSVPVCNYPCEECFSTKGTNMIMWEAKEVNPECFGNFNGQRSECAIECSVAVECYKASEQLG